MSATSFNAPLFRPKRGDQTPEAFAESLRLFDLEVARRFARAGVSERAPRQLNDEFEEEEEDEDEYEYLSDEESEVEEYEDYSDDEEDRIREENSERPLNHKVVTMTHEEFYQSMEQDCPLCLDEMKRSDCVTTNCNHSYCASCYEKYTKRSCPCCRQYVNMLTTYQLRTETTKKLR
jgi:hypothetical protein